MSRFKSVGVLLSLVLVALISQGCILVLSETGLAAAAAAAAAFAAGATVVVPP